MAGDQRSFIAPTLKHLADEKIDADVVERFIRTGRGPDRSGFRKDWHSFADIIGFDREYLYAVQVCHHSTAAAHVAKILNNPMARALVMAPQLVPRILLCGWEDVRMGGTGGKTKLVLRPRVIGLADFLDKEANDRIGS